MKFDRTWVTPAVGGAFLLLAVTGVLMFFHLDSGLNKLAHEWLGWVLLAAVAIHLSLNLRGLTNTLRKPLGKGVAALFLVLLAGSFLPLGDSGGGKAAFIANTRALAQAPLPALAQVAGISEAELARRLDAAGYPVDAGTASVSTLTGPDLGASAALLARIMASGAD
jgi:hypothetical protein